MERTTTMSSIYFNTFPFTWLMSRKNRRKFRLTHVSVLLSCWLLGWRESEKNSKFIILAWELDRRIISFKWKGCFRAASKARPHRWNGKKEAKKRNPNLCNRSSSQRRAAGRGAKYDLFIQSLNQSFRIEKMLLSESTHWGGNVRSVSLSLTLYQYPFGN